MNGYIRQTDVAKQLGINENTFRRWVLKYSEYISTTTNGKMKYIHEDSIPTLALIKGYYAENKKENEIKDLLDSNVNVIRDADATDITDGEQVNEQKNNQLAALTPEVFMALRKEMAGEIKQEIGQQFEQQFQKFGEQMTEHMKHQLMLQQQMFENHLEQIKLQLPDPEQLKLPEFNPEDYAAATEEQGKAETEKTKKGWLKRVAEYVGIEKVK